MKKVFQIWSLHILCANMEQPEYLTPARRLEPVMPTHFTVGWWSSMLPRLHHGNALPVAPWHVPRSPLAALALLLSAVAAPVFQAATLFQQWLITVLMKCEGSGNVTGMTWACQCGPAGRSVSHTDIWKGTEHQPLAAFSKKELLITWAGFCWIYVTQFFTYSIISVHWQSAPRVWVSSWCLLLSLYWLNEM